MFKPALALALAAGTVAGMVWATPDLGWRDVLDTPAVASPLAARALVNGLASAGSRIVAVGQRGHVLLSDDQGRTWRQVAVPVSSDLVAVTFPSATDGWAVGHDGVLLHSTDAGASWARVLDGRSAGASMLEFYRREAATLVPDAKRAAALLDEAGRFASQGAENSFLDVGFESATTGYVVGAFGLALRTTDGGVSWQPLLHALDNPKALHLYAVRAVGGEVYIAGEQGLLLKLDRASGQFRALDLPYKGTLFGIAGNARALVVHGLRGTVLRSTDAGRSWQTVATGLQVGLTGSATGADGLIVIASQAGHVLVSHDDGASFALAKIDKPTPAAAVALAANGAVVVGGPRGLAAVATLP
jgi:photosystem II stability/assembly factor-like uncharacterized protein